MNSPTARPSTHTSISITEINTVLRSGGLPTITQHELAMVGSQIDLMRFNTTLAAIRGPRGVNRDRAVQFMRGLIDRARSAIAGGAEIPASPWPDPNPRTVAIASLRDVNTALTSIGLPALRRQHVEPLLRTYGRTEILRLMTLAVAGGETGDKAKSTLESMIAEIIRETGQDDGTVPSAEVHALHGAPRSAADELPDTRDGDAGGAPGYRPASAPRGPAPNAARQPAGARGAASAPETPRDPGHRTPANPATGSPRAAGRTGQDRVQCKAYGTRAAITVEPAETEAGIPTVRFEFAPTLGASATAHPAVDDSATDKPGNTYDWSKKLIIQLTADEVPQLLAVLYGFAPSAQFSNHGQSKVKWMSLENQDKSIFMRAGDKDVPILVIPVSSPSAIMQIANIATLVIRKRYAALTGDDIRLLVKNQVAQRTKPVQQNRTGAR